MSTDQAPEVTHAAGVSHTSLFSLPVFVQVGVEGSAGQITETSIHTVHSVLELSCMIRYHVYLQGTFDTSTSPTTYKQYSECYEYSIL